MPPLEKLEHEIHQALSGLSLSQDQVRGRRIAIALGSRGIASLREIARALCGWVKNHGGTPFVFPAMGSHGGATSEGQRKILEGYGVTADYIGAEIRSSMQAISLGTTPEGIEVFVDRNAWEADGVLVMNRVKTHTAFSGQIESGVLKMIAVGMGKVEGATEFHRWARRSGYEAAIRALAAPILAGGKVLAGVAVVENQFHQIAAVRAARPEELVAMEEATLRMARPLIPRIPSPSLDLLIVDELGKNVSGTGMDTKSIGRGVELQAGEAPEIRTIYVRDLTSESGGNAVGVGYADLIHERLYRKIDFDRTYINARTSLNPGAVRLPIHMPSDREALRLALAQMGGPDPKDQRLAWIRNTLNLNRIAVSERLAREADRLEGWRLSSEPLVPKFDSDGNIASPV
jgi:Domain of unknown function (DUF362)